MKAQIQSGTIQGILLNVFGTLTLVLRLGGIIDIPESEVRIFIELLWGIGSSIIVLVGWIKTWRGRLNSKEPLGGFFKP